VNHLGLDGKELARKLFPRRRLSRPKRYLRRPWRALLAPLGTIGVAVTMAVATIVAPYNAFTGRSGRASPGGPTITLHPGP
jgi:hypothetical protein